MIFIRCYAQILRSRSLSAKKIIQLHFLSPLPSCEEESFILKKIIVVGNSFQKSYLKEFFNILLIFQVILILLCP